MKIWILAAALTCVSSFGQGTIRFATRIEGVVDAPVFGANGYGPGPAAQAQLFHVIGSGGSIVYTPLQPTTTFRDPGQFPLRAAYVVEPAEPVSVPGVLPGQQATIVLRVFQGPSFDSALFGSYGESSPISITLGGRTADGAELPPAPLVGLQGFTALSAWSWRPHLLFLGQDGEGMHFRVYPPTLLPSLVESSNDLQSWQPGMTNSVGATNIVVEFANESAPRFFRLRELSP